MIRFLDGPGGITAKKLNLAFDDLRDGSGGGGAYTESWTWTTKTTDAANAGQLGIDAITWAAAHVNINEKTSANRDMTLFLGELFVSPNELYIQQKTDSTRYAVYIISGAGTDHGTWWSFPVTLKSSGGLPPGGNADTTVTVLVKGGAGGGGDMLKSVYDTNADNIVDHAALADAAPWTGISGRPSSFTPSAHASTHLDNGTDIVPVVTSVRTGLAPKLSGNAATYLDGTGVFSTPTGAGSVDPGSWTAFSYAAGWSESATARYRIQTAGAIKMLYCMGAIAQAAGAAALALSFPLGARPSVTRNLVLAGMQLADGPDVVLYHANVSTTGDVTIYPIVKRSFAWPIETDAQTVYLDSLFFTL